MLQKEVIKRIIAENQLLVTRVRVNHRDYRFEPALNYVLVGLRRAGKSYLLYQRMQQLLAAGHDVREMLYFNFEDDRLDGLTLADLDLIKTTYEETYALKPIFFLDEIQIVDRWEKFARRLADTGYRVYITGSNARMLSSEISTTLGGRYMVQQVYPYSFPEFLAANQLHVTGEAYALAHQAAIVRQFNAYFTQGGLPEIQQVDDKRSWLSNLYNKIFFGDMVQRHAIRNDYGLRVLVRKLAESVRNPLSFTRMARIVTSTGKRISTDTVIDYVGYLQESWLILPFENLNARLADREQVRKYYFVDNGLLSLFLLDGNTALLENMVAVNLRRVCGDEAYYYRNGVEVDFYLPQQQLAIQACYTVADASTLEREVRAMTRLATVVPVSRMLIITRDEERTLTMDGHTIEIKPLWKWLLQLPQGL